MAEIVWIVELMPMLSNLALGWALCALTFTFVWISKI